VDVLKTRLCKLSLWAPVVAALLLASPGAALAKPEKGKPAPPFNLVDLWTDALVSLEDMAYPGAAKPGAARKPVLLDFFSTDCAPCKKSLPRLVKLYGELNREKVRFFIVAIPEPERGREKLEAYFKKHPMPFQVLVDKYGRAARDYASAGDKKVELPSLFIVGKQGKLRLSMKGDKGKQAFDRIARKLRALAR